MPLLEVSSYLCTVGLGLYALQIKENTCIYTQHKQLKKHLHQLDNTHKNLIDNTRTAFRKSAVNREAHNTATVFKAH